MQEVNEELRGGGRPQRVAHKVAGDPNGEEGDKKMALAGWWRGVSLWPALAP